MRAAGVALVVGLLLLLGPIRAKDVVNKGDRILGDDAVAQVLRIRLANDSSVRKAQKCTHSLAHFYKSKQSTPDTLDLS
jgi:hypothetical protein